MKNRRSDHSQRNSANQNATTYKSSHSPPSRTKKQYEKCDQERQMKLEAGESQQESSEKSAAGIHRAQRQDEQQSENKRILPLTQDIHHRIKREETERERRTRRTREVSAVRRQQPGQSKEQANIHERPNQKGSSIRESGDRPVQEQLVRQMVERQQTAGPSFRIEFGLRFPLRVEIVKLMARARSDHLDAGHENSKVGEHRTVRHVPEHLATAHDDGDQAKNSQSPHKNRPNARHRRV